LNAGRRWLCSIGGVPACCLVVCDVLRQRLGDLAREMLDGEFNLGRNTIAVVEPAVGGFFVSVGCGMVLDPSGSGGGVLRNLCVIVAGISLVVGVLGLIPVRLPGWMYPEWHEERRWRRAEQAEWEARYGSEDEGDDRAD